MASTQQFAFEYIQNGRELLERHLQKPSFVADKLGKLKILSQKEVRKIQSYKTRAVKTRVLLDLVFSKGEIASYEFLKTLYDTRNKTLPVVNTQNQSGSDLHQWISCFSFTEDPDVDTKPIIEMGACEKYRWQLRRKAETFFQAKWKRHMYFLKDKAKCTMFNYIPLVLDTNKSELLKTKSKGFKKTRTNKLKTYIPVGNGNLSPADLLKNDERTILLVGKPGIGKTTVVEQVLRLLTADDEYLGHYVFFFDEPLMRSMSHAKQLSSVKSLLFDKYLKPEAGTEDKVMQDILENSENVIIVFDGILDEISNGVIKGTLQKELLPEAKVIATCRPEAEESEFLSEWPSFRVEVKGFTEESIQAYFRWMLDTEDDNTCSVLKNFALVSLCHVPMYAFVVTACLSFNPMDADHDPCTITEMYVRIFRHCMKRCSNQKAECLDQLVHGYGENIKSLAMPAFEGMLKKNIYLTGFYDKDNYVQNAFLTASATKDSSTGGQCFSFLHNTMQEFWSALFLLMTPENITPTLEQCVTEDGKYLKHVIFFLCGLLSSSISGLIKRVVSKAQIEAICEEYVEKILDTFLTPEKQDGHRGCDAEVDIGNVLFACQCLYEHQSPKACSQLLLKVNYELNLSDEHLDPQQCCALEYVINQSKDRSVHLCLDHCSFCSRGLKLILGCLKNVSCLRLDSVTCCQMWKAALQQETQKDTNNLLRLCDYKIHLNLKDQEDLLLLPGIREILMQRTEKIMLCLHLGDYPVLAAQSLGKSIFNCLSNIEIISFFEPVDWRQSTSVWYMKVQLFKQDLLLHAALHQLQTGLLCVEDLHSVLGLSDEGSAEDQSKFMLSLYQHIRRHETNKRQTIMPALRTVFRSTPAVWHMDLCERKAELLLEVLKLQGEKKPVELRGSAHEERDLKNVLRCVPYISQLSCDEEFFISLCETLSVSAEMGAHTALNLIQALQHTISLSGWLTTDVCKAIANVLDWSESSDKLDLTLAPESISLQAAKLLIKPLKVLNKLRINEMGAMQLARLAKLTSFPNTLVVQELALVLSSAYPTEGQQCEVLSSVAFLLRRWKVKTLNMTSCLIDSLCLTNLLCHQGLLTIRLSQESLELLAKTVHEVEDEELTANFLEKIGRDLSDYTLEWNTLHYLLKSTTQTITVDLRKSSIKQSDILQLLPVLGNVKLQRINSHFMKTILRVIFLKRAGHLVASLLKSSDEWIDLSDLTLDHTDCEALRFALHYSAEVKLNLDLTVVPKEELWNILVTLSLQRVTELRLNKSLLLELLHVCASQGKKANSVTPELLRLLQYKLDLSHSAATDPTKREEDQIPCISSQDCRVLVEAICQHDGNFELNLCGCQVEDAALEELLPVLHKVHLRIRKSNLRRLLVLINAKDVELSRQLAISLSKALGDEVDLSQTPLDSQACKSLALLLEYSEPFSQLDLSSCSISDSNLDALIPHLHKVKVLNFCNNEITDEGAIKLNHYIIGNSFTASVLLSDNKIREFPNLVMDKRYRVQPTHTNMGSPNRDLPTKGSTSVKKVSVKTKPQIQHSVKPFNPFITNNNRMTYKYRFRCCDVNMCEATGLGFEMKGPGTVEYFIENWNNDILANSDYEPAGPLYNIKSPEGQLHQLFFPHCETDVYAAENLCLVHVMSGNKGIEFLKPKKVTRSHVIASIDGLSKFQVIRKKIFRNRCVKGHVLFFLQPDVTEKEHRLWVFLLPRSLPISEVQKHNSEYVFIRTCSKCILRPRAKYSVGSVSEGLKVQPKICTFDNDTNVEQVATFEVFLHRTVKDLRLKIVEKWKRNERTLVRWWRRLIITGYSAGEVSAVRRPTEKEWIASLVELLEELTLKQMKKLKGMMGSCQGRSSVPKSSLEGLVDPWDLAELITSTWGFEDSVQAIVRFMKRIPRNDDRVRSLLQPYSTWLEEV